MTDLNKLKITKIQDGKKILKNLELELEEKNKTLTKLIKSKQHQLENLRLEIKNLDNQEQQSQKEHQKIMFDLENLKSQISVCRKKIISVNTQVSNEQNDDHFKENFEQLKMNIEDLQSKNCMKMFLYQESINNFFFCLQQELMFMTKKTTQSKKSKKRCFFW